MTTYITTPIYYVNAKPHLGHAYTTVIADTYSRFKKICGDEVLFQTGTDEHGDKIAEAADKDGILPKLYVDKISGMFRETWPKLSIAPDNFIRTTDATHIQTVKDILQKVYDKGDIYFDKYTGLYCKGCERFLTEKELVDGKCPDHQTNPEEVTEQNYFFRMSKYQQQLIDHIKTNPDFITPKRYKNEVLSFLSESLEDLCISRPTSRLTWGIELPFDDKFVTYVWFDALINYLTGIGYPDGNDFDKYWSVAEHVIAKDILKPHAIYWPTMLMSLGLKPYAKLHVHGYWNIDETKMSKSIGNVVRPGELVDAYGVDVLRYYILREMSFGLDASFSNDAIIARQNSDLANDLGNLFSRSLAMLNKYRDGKVPIPGKENESDKMLIDSTKQMIVEYQEEMSDFKFHKAMASVWSVVGHANRYIVSNEPWALAADKSQEERLNTVLYNLVETLRILTLVLSPVMPAHTKKMAKILGLAEDNVFINDLEKGGRWGIIDSGIQVGTVKTLFPRIDKKIKNKQVVKKKSNKNKKSNNKAKASAAEVEGMITFDQFKDVDLRVAEIVKAERIKKSDRLLKLQVKSPEDRVIVAGIAEYYTPEDLIGRQVVIVANLKPVKLMGVESNGMVLAAKTTVDGEERLVLSALSEKVISGSKVS